MSASGSVLVRSVYFLPAMLLAAGGLLAGGWWAALGLILAQLPYGIAAGSALGFGSYGSLWARRGAGQLVVVLVSAVLIALFFGVPTGLWWGEWAWPALIAMGACAVVFTFFAFPFWSAPAVLLVGREAPERPVRQAIFAARTALDLPGRTDLQAVVAFAGYVGVMLGAMVVSALYPVTMAPLPLAVFGVLIVVVSPVVHLLLLNACANRMLETEVDVAAEPTTAESAAVATYGSDLLNAAHAGDLAALQRAYDDGAELEPADEEDTALAAAIEGGQPGRLEVLEWLIDQGADINHRDEEGRTPLHLAARHGDLGALEVLVQAGADLGAVDNDRLTPLGRAARHGQVAWMERAIALGAEVDPADAEPPLHQAAGVSQESTAGVDLLIEHGADVSSRGRMGRTALMAAAMRGNAHAAESLLQAGIDIDAQDDFGNTALMEAARSGANAVLERFVFWNPRTEPRDKPGRTALLVAVASRRADADTVRLLLAMGADAQVTNREGRSAAELAHQAGRRRIAEALGKQYLPSEMGPESEPVAPPAEARPPAKPKPVEPPAAPTEEAPAPEDAAVIDLAPFISEEDRAWAAQRTGGADAAEAREPEAEVAEVETPEAEPEAPAQSTGPSRAARETVIEAARRDDPESIKAVMEVEDIPAPWLVEAFREAVAAGHTVTPHWLLENGLAADAVDEQGVSLLDGLAAHESIDLDIVEMLVQRAVEPQQCGQMLLAVSGMRSIANEIDDPGRVARLVSELLEKGADPRIRSTQGRTPLHWAVDQRSSDVVQILLDNGAEVDAQDAEGNTPLMLAADSSRTGVVRQLIRAGADPRKGNAEGRSPMAVAVDAQDHTLLNLMGAKAEVEPSEEAARASATDAAKELFIAATEGNLGRVKRMLGSGVHVDVRDDLGCTPLIRAAGEGHVTVVATLLAAGANDSVASANGTTPIGAAVLGGHREVVTLLLGKSTPVDQAQQAGLTPLMLAAARWQYAMVGELLRAGADVEARDSGGTTALMASVQNAWQNPDTERGLRTLKALLEAGSTVDGTDERGRTALMLLLGARIHNEPPRDEASLLPFARELLDAGADVNHQDAKGRCALHSVARHGLLEAAKLLVGAGATRRRRDDEGLSPTDIAMREGQLEVMEYLLAAERLDS